jgi:hypothetical protein
MAQVQQCKAVFKTGKRVGQQCPQISKLNGYCLLHANAETARVAKAAKKESEYCVETTLKGTRCSRLARKGYPRCAQHMREHDGVKLAERQERQRQEQQDQQRRAEQQAISDRLVQLYPMIVMMFLDSEEPLEAKREPRADEFAVGVAKTLGRVKPTGDWACSICCGEHQESLAETLCRHVYHIQCLRTWLGKAQSCPMCRETITTAKLDAGYISDSSSDSDSSELDSDSD